MAKSKKTGWTLVLYNCHFPTITIEGPHGATRVLGGKCCPRQYIRDHRRWQWPLDREKIAELTEELSAAAEQMEKPDAG